MSFGTSGTRPSDDGWKVLDIPVSFNQIDRGRNVCPKYHFRHPEGASESWEGHERMGVFYVAEVGYMRSLLHAADRWVTLDPH